MHAYKVGSVTPACLKDKSQSLTADSNSHEVSKKGAKDSESIDDMESVSDSDN